MRPLRPTIQALLCLIGVLLCDAAWAQQAQVRASLETRGTIWVGQAATVVVEVLAPGYFSSAVSFDLPDPHGVLLLPPMGHPILSSQTINDTSYTVQRHELSAFPMRAGKESIPAFTVRFSFKSTPADTKDTAATLTTTPIAFTVTIPPGAEGLGQVISAKDLRITETWHPALENTSVPAGSAFIRTISFTAPDVPGMIFPPFPTQQIDGLGIYTKRQLLDQTDAGSLHGERRDVITYVCQRPGQFTIPAARFTWFDVDATQLRNIDLPAHTLNVVANPAVETARGAGPTGAGATLSLMPSWQRIGLVAAILLIVLLVVLVGRSARFRTVLAGLLIPLRPWHLQILNPTERSRSGV